MIRAARIVFLALLVLGGCGGGDDGGGSSSTGGATTYTSDFNGLPATAVVTLEPLITHTVMSGQIQSGIFMYTFTADLVGSSGYGTLLDAASGLRSSIHIDLTATGFILDVNVVPDPGPSTRYVFTRV